jgi:hypothetical protein
VKQKEKVYMNKSNQKTSSVKTEGQPVYAGSRIVGQVYGDTFSKTITGSKHLLRTPPAIAFDVATIDQAVRLGAVKVRVYDRESENVYKCSIDHLKENGFTFNRGFGEQIALVMDGWIKTRKGQPEQLSLLGGLK